MNVHTIVVGVDDSPGARRTLEWLATAVKGTAADVIAVHCLEPQVSATFSLPPLDYDDWRELTIKAFEDKWCAPLQRAGTPHRRRVVDFEPAEGLRFVADEEDADLIVVGSHGHDRPGRGVPAELIGHTHRPVLVVSSAAAASNAPVAAA